MDRLADFVIGRRKTLLYGVSGVIVLLAVLVPQIELNDQFVEYFDESIEFRRDTDYATEHLSGIYQAQWSLPSGKSGGVSDPEFLKVISDFSDWLRAREDVVHVTTLSDIFKRLNMYQPLLMNKSTYDGLSDAQKAALDAAAEKAEAYYLAEAKKQDANSVKVFKEAGVEIAQMTAEEFQAWRDIAQSSSYAKFISDVPNGQKLLDMALSVE